MSDEANRRFFTRIAPNYNHLTGYVTKNLLIQVLDLPLKINWHSLIHDNACGPGTATETIIEWSAAHSETPKIVATDYVPAMIDAMEVVKSRHAESKLWANVEAKQCDSADLSDWKEGTFSHTFCNFSIFTFAQPLACLKEIHRTLRPKGLAVITAWKRFPMSVIMSSAQAHVKGEEWVAENPVKTNGPEFVKEGYLANMVSEAGWELGMIKTLERRELVRRGLEWDGLQEFLVQATIMATNGWSDEERSKWPEAVDVAMKKEEAQYGGVLFEAWVVLAQKWDALCG